MSTTSSNPVDTAVEFGTISKAAAPAASAAVGMANPNTGLAADQVAGTRVFLVQVVIDNSGSMKNFEDPVRRSYTKLREELIGASGEGGCEVLVSVYLLHGGLIQPYAPVQETVELTDANHKCDGDTPLYGRTNELLGTLIVKANEFKESGRKVLTFTALITDGEATDGKSSPRGGEGRSETHDENQVRDVIVGLQAAKEHIICGVSIGGGATATFTDLGIPAKWQLEPDRDGFAFDAAMAQVSRASRSASKGAGAFQSVAGRGFR